MTPLALAATLEAKHKALVEAQKTYVEEKLSPRGPALWDAINFCRSELHRSMRNNLPTLLTALRESGEAIELRRENEQLKRHLDEATHWREVLSNDLVAMSRLIPERKK